MVNCSSSPNFTVSAGQTVNITSLLPGSGANGIIVLIDQNATLVINASFTLTNCTIRANSGAAINTTGTGTVFTASGTHFINCNANTTWNGITVNTGSTIKFSTNFIRNAVDGLRFPAGYNASTNELVANLFLQNTTHIRVGSLGLTTLGFTKCFNNHLEGGTTGIFMGRTTTLNFGTDGKSRNLINGPRIGIISGNGSLLRLTNTAINNTVSDGTVNSAIGISMTASSLFVESIGNNCLFDNNIRFAIRSNNPINTVSIKNASFTGNQRRDIEITNSLNPCNVLINNNEFTHDASAHITAIYVQRPPTPQNQSCEIILNKITITDTITNSLCTLASSIDVRGTAGATNTMNIKFNKINNAADCDYNPAQTFSTINNGILVQGPGNNVVTSGNTIKYTATTNTILDYANFGIAYVNMPGTGHKLTGNTVTSMLAARDQNSGFHNKSVIQCGIHCTDVPDSLLICQNTVDSTHRGFHLGGGLTGCTFGQNDMNHHVFGLYCFSGNGTSVDIGDQFQRANTWSTNLADYIAGGFGARYVDIANVPFDFFVNFATPGFVPPSALPTIPNWFQDNSTPPQYCGGLTPTEPPYFSDIDVNIAANTYPSSYPANLWDLRRTLWIKILRTPNSQSLNPTVLGFYNTTLGGSAQRFADAFHRLNAAMKPTPVLAQDWADAQAQTIAAIAEIARLDSLIGLDSVTVNPVNAAALAQEMQVLRNLNQTMETITTTYTTTRDQSLLQLQNLVNQLPSIEAYESAWKTILTQAILQYMGTALTQAQRNEFITIANACPDELGLAVTSVVGYMPQEDSYPYIGREDFGACQRTSKPGSTVAAVSDLIIAPNPGQDRISITVPGTDKGIWQVYTLSGTLMGTGQVGFSQTQTTVETQSYPTGVYLFVLHRNGTTLTKQFMTAK